MYVPLREGYLLLVLPFLCIWIALFLLSKKTRQQQLRMSVIMAPLGGFGELLYFQDYWRPLSVASFSVFHIPFLVEDVLFSIAIGGIAAVIYEFLFRKRIRRLKKTYPTKLELLLILMCTTSLALFLFHSGINSIFATSFAFVVGFFLIIMQRKDLLIDSLITGLCVMLVMFISYFILYHTVTNIEQLLKQGWLLYNTPLGVRIFNIPATEMIWGFSWGLLAGPLYLFVENLSLASK
jgi:hypothetical protein